MKSFLYISFILLIGGIVSCKKDGSSVSKLTAIFLTKDTLVMNAGDVRTVGFTLTPSTFNSSLLVWKSSDTTILKVNSSGTITAKSQGTAVVTVSSQDGSLSKYCTISVLPLVDPLAVGLIAYYPFNNNARDLSGNINDGTAFNVTSVADRKGKANSAYHFDGFTSYISVADNYALRLSATDFTLSTWINVDAYNTSYVSSIISKRFAGTNNGYIWGVNGPQNPPPLGANYFGPGSTNSNNAFGIKPMAFGTWYMITCVFTQSNSQMIIYVNGVLDKTVTGVLAPIAANTATLYIGKDGSAGANGYYFQGTLDDLRIYGKALDAATVLKLYNAVY